MNGRNVRNRAKRHVALTLKEWDVFLLDADSKAFLHALRGEPRETFMRSSYERCVETFPIAP